MRSIGLWALLAGFALLFTAGCGGGGGGTAVGTGGGTTSGTTRLAGIWTGSSTKTGATGTGTNLQIEFFQTGNAITGTASATGAGGSAVGTVTGTITGNTFTATIQRAVPQAADPQPITVNVYGYEPIPNVTYSTGQAFDLSKPITATVAGGAYPATPVTKAGVPYSYQFTLPVLVQAGQPIQVTFTPYITDALPGSTVTLTGTVNGNRITGSYSTPATATNASVTGAFTLTRPDPTTGALPSRIALGSTGVWNGHYTITLIGGTVDLAVQFTQNKDNLSLTGTSTVPVNGNNIVNNTSSVSGGGAIIGDQVTLVVNDAAGGSLTLNGTVALDATHTQAVITGTLLTNIGLTGTFTLVSPRLVSPIK